MKTIISITATVFVFSFFAVVCNANAGDSPVEFRGYVELDGSQLFSLKSTQGGGSAWVRLGQSFCKGKLVDYDRVSESVTFSSSEGTFIVKMFKAEGSRDLAGDYVKLSQTDLANVSRRTVTKRGSIPRISTSRTREEKEAARRANSYSN